MIRSSGTGGRGLSTLRSFGGTCEIGWHCAWSERAVGWPHGIVKVMITVVFEIKGYGRLRRMDLGWVSRMG